MRRANLSCTYMGSHTRAMRRSQQDLDHLFALRQGGLDGLAGSSSLTLPRMIPNEAGKISPVQSMAKLSPSKGRTGLR
jgi:hypothetical protein